MKLYFERHDGSAVTCDDFVRQWQMQIILTSINLCFGTLKLALQL